MDNTMNPILNHIKDKRKKNAKCETCGKTLSTARNLKAHINSLHDGQKDHKCDSCGKQFSRAGNLKTHINSVHNGQKHQMLFMWKVVF